jgi:hypothetical protein
VVIRLKIKIVLYKNTVAKCIKNLKIAGVLPCLFKTTTIRDTKMSYPPDLIKRQFIKEELDTLWSPDIT